MANTFKSYINANVTALTTVYTGPAATATTVIGLSLANTGASLATASVSLIRNGSTVYVVKNAQIPLGDALVLFGGDQKLVIQTGDQLKVLSDQNIDVIVSILEIA